MSIFNLHALEGAFSLPGCESIAIPARKIRNPMKTLSAVICKIVGWDKDDKDFDLPKIVNARGPDA